MKENGKKTRLEEIGKTLLIKVFGSEINLRMKLSLSFLTSSLIFIIFAFIYHMNFNGDSVFTYISAVFFTLWLLILKEKDALDSVMWEFVRIVAFFWCFIGTTKYCVNICVYNQELSIIKMFLSCLGMFFCTYYLACKVTDIFGFVKKMFKQLKIKLFNSDAPATSKVRSLIENCMAFLASITAFAVAIKTITETIFQMVEYF